jgi:hypothetical protein
MSGTDPRGRKVGREQLVKRVRNPAGETNRGWTPGPVDLPAFVAEGETEAHEGRAGAAQDSGGESEVHPEGKSKPTGVPGTSVPGSESRKTARP